MSTIKDPLDWIYMGMSCKVAGSRIVGLVVISQ